MHRQRFGYAAVFGWSPPGHEQGAALNHPSQPRGRALMRDVPSTGPLLGKARRQHASWGLREGVAPYQARMHRGRHGRSPLSVEERNDCSNDRLRRPNVLDRKLIYGLCYFYAKQGCPEDWGADRGRDVPRGPIRPRHR
jgi:hypothetical protein